MEEDEDIKILETQIQACKECKFATCEQCEISYTEVKAIENLIARYKEVKERECIYKTTSSCVKGLSSETLNKLNDYIPKSKAKEKEKELDDEDLEIYDTDSEDVIIAKYEDRAVLDFCNSILEES